MGTLYKRGGTYYGDYIDRGNARRRTSLRTTDPQVARARLRELELATTDRGAHPTEALSDALDYFTAVACAHKSAATRSCYSQKARHISRLIGAVLCDRLSRETIERYIADRLGEGAHPHTVHKEIVVLRGALKSARGRDLYHGPIEIVPQIRSGYVPRTSYLTEAQFLALVPHLARSIGSSKRPAAIERRERRAQHRALYCLLIAFASPRRGELEALTWPDVDLARGVIRLPKGKTIGRPVAIHPVVAPWLEAFGEIAGWTGPVVAPWPNVGRDLPAACARAGVPRVVPTDLRRTFASWLIQAGVSNRIVAHLLGHTTTRMVDLVYGRLDDRTLTEAILKLPGCDAGVTHETARSDTGGTPCHSGPATSIVNSVEDPLGSSLSVVPRDGVEPPTRGFSVLMDLVPKVARSRVKLRAV